MVFHVLNGDALKDQLSGIIRGELIVARECLIDGPVDGELLEHFFQQRAEFIEEAYGNDSGSYFDLVVPEFDKLLGIPNNTTINLWFEDDLFCQVNFWFICHLLSQKKESFETYLIRPIPNAKYGFGSMDTKQLKTALYKRVKLFQEDLEVIAELWNAYRSNDPRVLLESGNGLPQKFSFILPAIHAQLDRLPKNGNPGRPEATLIQIMHDLQTTDFGPVFKEFSERENIYGFGDLQVRHMFDEILNQG
ncbi:MAG: DUF1835 domain-containing protein [Bacteroidetes bacterium]|nr:MAG: DUF1835 domain-containing protein [Bacteroidota bacterium]